MSAEQPKTHYRKVFKSDHLGQADLEDFKEDGSKLIFTIAYVNQEIGAKVAGKKIDANIAYFVERIKPLVLNATNSATMKKLTGSAFIEDWQNVVIQLYIEPNVKMKGETVGGVRISHLKPKIAKPLLTKDNIVMWNHAKTAYKQDGNFIRVFKKADITPENQRLMISEINAEDAANV
tara:strand:+ start:56 stop:589 length:534 start_codon:yes stop_codon:yes gene_type:complete